MRLFWKVFTTVFISFLIVVLPIIYLTTVGQISQAQDHIVEENTVVASFMSKEVEKGYQESRWPFESLRQLSERKDFLFWWVVRDDGAIHLAEDTSFMGTHISEYFPELANMEDEDVYLNRNQNYGILVRTFEAGEKKWSFWLGFSLRELLQIRKEIILGATVICILALGTLGAILYLVTRYFTKPIGELTAGAATIGKGDLTYRIKAGSKDELGQLGRSFNKMAHDLQKITVSRDYVDSIIESMGGALTVVTSADTIEVVNQAALDLLGYEENELVGKSVGMILEEWSQGSGIRDSIKKGFARNLEETYLSKEGERIPVLFSSSVLRDAGGRIQGTVCVAQDIRELKKMEQELQKRTYDLGERVKELRCLYSISNLVEKEGISLEEILEGTVHLIPPSWEYPEITCARIVLDGRTFKTNNFKETTWRQTSDIVVSGKKIGAVEVLYLEKKPKSDEGPFSKEERSLINAISERLARTAERNKAEEELRSLNQFRESIIDNADVWLDVLDAEKNLVIWNKAAENISGYSRKEVVGHDKIWEWLYPDEEYRKEVVERVAAIIQKGKVDEDFETRIQRKDGQVRTISWNSRNLLDEKGNPIGSIALGRDITEQKKAKEKLREKSEELARSNSELEQFAYVASHDLQEPLRMVSSYVQLLEQRYKDKLDSDADEFITYAVDGASRMHRMINGLLEYSRLNTRGKAFRPTDSRAVLDHALANLGAVIEESGVVVTSNSLPTVMADDVQLTQLFQNLISNAIKFHGEAPPRIDVSAEKKSKKWVFSFRDNGIGIQSEYAERIFQMFQRLHSRQDYPGTGIGLAICKKIVERHGGRIWVESQPGKGSTFCFTIPTGK